MRPADPQAQRRDGARVPAGAGSSRSPSWLGHSRSPGTTSGAPSRAARSSSGSPRSSLEAVGEPALRLPRPATRGQRVDGAHALDQREDAAASPGSASRPRSSRASRSSSGAPCRQPRHARRGAQVRWPAGRRPRAVAVRPPRSARVQARRSTRSTPRADSRAGRAARRRRAPTSAPDSRRSGPRSTEPGTWRCTPRRARASGGGAVARASQTRSRTGGRLAADAAMSSTLVGWCTATTGRRGRAAGRTAGRGSASGQRACSVHRVPVVAKPHGHGFAASTSWNRAGNATAPRQRCEHDLAGLERLPQRVERRRARTPAPRRGTARRGGPATAAPGRASPTPPPTIAAGDAVWCGARNGGRRRPARGPRGSAPATEWIAVTSSDSVAVEVGQQPGQPLGEHRLAGARRAVQEQVVPARRRHLEGERRVGLPGDVGEVEAARPPRRPPSTGVVDPASAPRHRLAAQVRATSSASDAAPRRPSTPGDQRRLGRVGRRHDDRATPRRRRGEHRTAARRAPGARRPSRPSSPMQHHRPRPRSAGTPRRRRAPRRRWPGRSPLPALGSAAGDRFSVIRRGGRPLLAAVDDGRTDAVPRLARATRPAARRG